MAIELIKKDGEELCEVIEGTEFYYKLIHGSTRRFIIKQNTKRGVTDWTGVIYDMIRKAVTRTKNLLLDGKEIDWDPEYAESLPGVAIERLSDLLDANQERKAEEAKNLPPTSGSSTKTKA